MALTTFEQNMIERIHNGIQNRKRIRRDTEQDATDLNTIIKGTEAERQALIASYINNVGIPECDKIISDCDAAKANAQTLKAEMESYVA